MTKASTICGACGNQFELSTSTWAAYRIPAARAVRFGVMPGMTRTFIIRLCRSCIDRPKAEVEKEVEARFLAQVDSTMELAARNNALPERCGFCGGHADMAHVQGHMHGHDVLFGSCEACRQEIASEAEETEVAR